MRIPIFLCLFIVFTGVWNILIKRGSLRHGESYDAYVDREREANLTIGKKLTEDLFIVPKIDNLPFRPYEDTEENKKILKLQATVSRKATLPMLKFDKVQTNTDLKLQYGINNLERIGGYEENYNAYIKSLVEWGELLLNQQQYPEAETVFLSALQFGSDLSANYIGLAKLYSEQGQTAKLAALKTQVEQSHLSMKQKILSQFELL